jgi:hypothetical protein
MEPRLTQVYLIELNGIPGEILQNCEVYCVSLIESDGIQTAGDGFLGFGELWKECSDRLRPYCIRAHHRSYRE